MTEPTPLETTRLTDLIKEQSHHLKEHSVNRTVEVLEAKRASFRREIQQLIRHIGLLIPVKGNLSSHEASQEMLLQEAAQRMGDDAFTQFLLQILQEGR